MLNHASVTGASISSPPQRADDIAGAGAERRHRHDKVEGVQRFYMFDVHFMHPQAIEFAEIIKKSIKALRKSMGSFREFKKLKKIRTMVEDVAELEERADALYMETIRQLYTEDAENAVRIEVWSRLFDRLEAICDVTKAVADTMATIALKNV